MNLNVFHSNSTSASVQSPLPVASSASVQKPIQDGTTTTEPTKHSSKSIVNSNSTLYWANVVNAPLSLMDKQENSSSEGVQARAKNKTTSKKRLYWGLQSYNNSK